MVKGLLAVDPAGRTTATAALEAGWFDPAPPRAATPRRSADSLDAFFHAPAAPDDDDPYPESPTRAARRDRAPAFASASALKAPRAPPDADAAWPRAAEGPTVTSPLFAASHKAPL